MVIVKLKFSVYICKGVPVWHMDGHLSYRVRLPALFFLFSDK